MIKHFFVVSIGLLFVFLGTLRAQDIPIDTSNDDRGGYTSARQEQIEFYNAEEAYANDDSWKEPQSSLGNMPTPFYDTRSTDNPTENGTCELTHEVYGYHPFWIGPAYYKRYNYQLLTTLSYFSYELNPKTGDYNNIHDWKRSKVIDYAQQAGCRVELCITNFGSKNNRAFLSNPIAWQRLSRVVIELLKYRNADGVNIDFEGVPADQKENYIRFIQRLSQNIKNSIKNGTVTIAVPAVDWKGVYDASRLDKHVDRFIIMGYDYHYAGGDKAGPVSPLYHGNIWKKYTINKTITDYIDKGATAAKLIMAVPYYGYEWKTSSEKVPSRAQAKGKVRTYRHIRNKYKNNKVERDSHSASPYYLFKSGSSYRQCWFDDTQSLGQRYDLVKSRGIGGVGIWALGYDNGYTDLWDLLKKKFSNCYEYCDGKVYDTGGPSGGYLGNEEYTMVFKTDPGNAIALNFDFFDLVDKLDYMTIYEGNSTSGKVLKKLTGKQLPQPIVSNNSAITVHFKSSNKSKGSKGWEMYWKCAEKKTEMETYITGGLVPTSKKTTRVTPRGTIDITPPMLEACNLHTKIGTIDKWNSSNFKVNFVDDNCLSGWEKRYYQVLMYNGGWYGNSGNGFINDDFNKPIDNKTAWLSLSGSWDIKNKQLQQNDEDEVNANIYTQLSQNGNDAYLYHWRAQMWGTGQNRRSGMHFFADDALNDNRGNSYFIYFRADQNRVELYKVVDNVWEKSVAQNDCVISANTWYDYKLTYDAQSGMIRAFVQNKLVIEWQDPNPIRSGNYLSLRTGNAKAKFDYVKVYKARGDAVEVQVGKLPTNDVTIASTNFEQPTCRIISLAQDKNLNCSNVDVTETFIEFKD